MDEVSIRWMPLPASRATSSPPAVKVGAAEPREESIFSATAPPMPPLPLASRSIARPSTLAAPALLAPGRPSMMEPATVRSDTLLVALSTVSTRRLPTSSSR